MEKEIKNHKRFLLIGLSTLGLALFGAGDGDCNGNTVPPDADTGTVLMLDDADSSNDADSGVGDTKEDVEEYNPEGNPPSAHIQGLIDILRTADHPECQREGAGWPIGQCPAGCMFGIAPSQVIDLERNCRISAQQLGGPPFCIPDMESGYWDCPQGDYGYCYCSDFDSCYIDTETEQLVLGNTTCGYHPQKWRSWSGDSDSLDGDGIYGNCANPVPPLCADGED